MKKVLVLYFSRTLASARAAREVCRAVETEGHRAELCELKSGVSLPYPLWLLLSFIPGIATPIMPPGNDPSACDGLVLVFPKWTFNCPPVTALVRRLGPGVPPVLVVVTMGGWDGPRYAESYGRALENKGLRVAGTLVLKRKYIGRGGEEGSLAAIRNFLMALKGGFP